MLAYRHRLAMKERFDGHPFLPLATGHDLGIRFHFHLKAVDGARRIQIKGHVVGACAAHDGAGLVNARLFLFAQAAVHYQGSAGLQAVVFEAAHRGGHAFLVEVDHLVDGIGHQHSCSAGRLDDGIGGAGH